jgi:hypothetical protein
LFIVAAGAFAAAFHWARALANWPWPSPEAVGAAVTEVLADAVGVAEADDVAEEELAACDAPEEAAEELPFEGPHAATARPTTANAPATGRY